MEWERRHIGRRLHLFRRHETKTHLAHDQAGRWHYEGRADDVLGIGTGQQSGNAFRWGYTLNLPVDDKVYEVQFDDWMYQMDDKVVINKAVMSKFGITLGELVVNFKKRG